MDNSATLKEDKPAIAVPIELNSMNDVVGTIRIICDTMVKDKEGIRENFQNHQENIRDLIASLKVVVEHISYLDGVLGKKEKLQDKLMAAVPQCFPSKNNV